MKKFKFISLILAVLMLLPLALTGCRGNGDIPGESSSESESESDHIFICGLSPYAPGIPNPGSLDYELYYPFDYNLGYFLTFDDIDMYRHSCDPNLDLLFSHSDYEVRVDDDWWPTPDERVVFSSIEDMKDRILNHKLTSRELYILATGPYVIFDTLFSDELEIPKDTPFL